MSIFTWVRLSKTDKILPHSESRRDSATWDARCCGWKPQPLLLLTICSIAVSLCGGTALADRDEQFVAGLRQRRLFELAERYCQQRLAEQDLSTKDRVVVTVELIRVHAEHALNAPAAERDAVWQAARDAAAQFLDDHRDQPRTVLVRVQDALTLLSRGELARMEAEVSSAPEQSLAAAREQLRQATRLLGEIDRELQDEIPRRRRNPLRPDQLTADELTALRHNIRFQLARAYKNQAICFPAGSNDHTASLTEALRQLEEPLSQLPPQDPLAVQVRLEQAICLRLLGDADAAEKSLQGLAQSELAPESSLQVRAERIRLLLAQQQMRQALQVISQGRKIGGRQSSELDFAFFETYVTSWKAAADANDQDTAGKWRDKSIATAKFIEQTHGAYWARRAELLLVRIGQGSGDGSLEILRRTADDLYRKGQLDDAVAAYEKAAAAAEQTDDQRSAFEFAYKAALVQQSRRLHDDASDRFRGLAVARKTMPHAASAHLLAIVNSRQASVAAGAWRDEYPELLQEHLKLWPTSGETSGETSSTPTSSIAALWLGEFQSGRRSWDEAIAAYSQVAASSEHYAEAIEAAGRCWLEHLAELSRSEQPLTDEAARGVAFFTSVVRGAGGELPESWTAAQWHAARYAAAIGLQFGDPDATAIERLLRAALDGAGDATPEWRSAAMSLLVVAVARQEGRQAEARALIEQIGGASIEQLWALREQIAGLSVTAGDAARSDLANLQLAIVELLRPSAAKLTAAQQVALERGYAEALAAASRTEEAIAAYRELAQQHPNDGEIQAGLGRLLLDSSDPATLRLALDQWRRVAARSKPRSPGWFQAKYSVALAQLQLGDPQSAAKLIRYLQATEDLAASGFEQQFADLLRRAENQTPNGSR